jgi:glycosyltransferase involved in cell wall biosynthesis
MKIMIVSSWYPPIQSGSSFYAESLAIELKKQGHSVCVVTTHWDSKTVRSYNQNDIEIHSLPVIVLPKMPFLLNLKIVPIASFPRNWRYLLSLATKFKPDIIHQVNHIFDTVFLSTKLAKQLEIPLVCSITTQLQHPNPMLRLGMKLIDRYLLGILAIQKCSSVICLDSEVRRYVAETYGSEVVSRSVIIAYGVRSGFYESIKNDYEVDNGARQIVMVGHIHALRDPSNLIRAMPKILKKFPSTKLLFAGRVQLERPVSEAKGLGLSGNVDFLGEVSHADIARLLRSSQLYVAWASGPYTGLGTACIEAMLCELPVVIDLPENLFGDGRLKNWDNIVLVHRENIDEIANNIIKLLEEDDLRRHIGINGRIFVQEQLSWEKIAREIEKVYLELMQKQNIRDKVLERYHANV